MPDQSFPPYQSPGQDDPYNPAGIYPEPASSGAPGNAPTASDSDPAVEMIRQKIRDLYAAEPDAGQEAAEAQIQTQPGSRHQQYMRELSSSGKNTVEIQTAWHNYYVGLPDHEKYQVWQEFYVHNGLNPAPQQQAIAPTPQAIPAPARVRTRQAERAAAAVDQAAARLKTAVTPENVTDIKQRITHSVKNASKKNRSSAAKQMRQTTDGSSRKLQPKHHLHSLAFGLASGLVVVFIFLFSFFNEFLIAPFIQPSRHSNNTPVIVDVASTVVAGGPKVIIPKINLEIPVDYSQTSIDEKQIELALDKGIVHYPTTVMPGQAGNTAYFGHSSNNIFNPGKYKFAFVLLHQLTEGDTFYLTNNGQTYAYRVFSKRIVEPSEVGVLLPVAGHAATATLITCDPPGTSLHRLVVVGDQISPDPGGNSQPTTPAPTQTAATNKGLPGNGSTLWARIWGSVF